MNLKELSDQATDHTKRLLASKKSPAATRPNKQAVEAVKEGSLQSVINIYNRALERLGQEDYRKTKFLQDYNTKWLGTPGRGEPWAKGFFMYLEHHESKFELRSVEEILRDLKPILLIGKDSNDPRNKKTAEIGKELCKLMDKERHHYRVGTNKKKIARDESEMSANDGAETLDPLGGVFSWERIKFCIYNIRRQVYEALGMRDIGFERRYKKMIEQALAQNNQTEQSNPDAASVPSSPLEPTSEQVQTTTHQQLEAVTDMVPMSQVSVPGQADGPVNDIIKSTGT